MYNCAAVVLVGRQAGRDHTATLESQVLPIRPVCVEVVGVHPKHARLLLVEIVLEPPPSAKWADLFNNFRSAYPGQEHFAPKVRGDTIVVTPPDDEMAEYVLSVERQIRAVNAQLTAASGEHPTRGDVIRLSQAVSRESFSEEVRRRILQARETARAMSGVFQSSEWEPMDVSNPPRSPMRDTMMDIRPHVEPQGAPPIPAAERD